MRLVRLLSLGGGVQDIHDGTLLVWGEQGLGDEIMFASMVPDLVDKGLNVVLECDARLVGLFSQSFPEVTCVASKSIPDPIAVEADFQVPSPALGQWFRCDESISIPVVHFCVWMTWL